jgi:hypothetical protein
MPRQGTVYHEDLHGSHDACVGCDDVETPIFSHVEDHQPYPARGSQYDLALVELL